MGTNIATEILKTPATSEHRLYQAVVVQAFEDCLYTLGGANLDPSHVHSRYKWCLENKVIVFTEVQCYWIEYKNEYQKYRGVDTKEERRSIKNRIDQIRYKLQLKDKKKK
jgi:hypothetical protein